MRALGLDVGSKTIGVAASDELGLCAHPVVTLARRGTRSDVAAVLEIARQRESEVIVAGLPMGLDGRPNQRTAPTAVFLEALEAAIAALGRAIRVERVDESYSTVAAERVLIEADLSRKRRKQVIDRAAAAHILQGWLDGRRGAG